MIDIKLIRENPKLVKESQRKRNLPERIIDDLLNLDKEWRKTKEEADDLRSERNKISLQINEFKKEKKDISQLIKRAKEIPERLKQLEETENELGSKSKGLLLNLPNIIDKSVPIGDASKNKVLKEYGKKQKYKFKIKGHEELLKDLDLLDLEKASQVSGARFYYLKGDMARLNYAIINFAKDFLSKKRFTFIQPPYMLNRQALSCAITLATFEDTIYKIENEDLYLIGTAEHALNAYYMNETIDAKKLPIRFFGISPCFRKEAGAHGKDTKGIFRVHQFDKIEQFVFCRPENSWKEFELILNNTTSMFKMLGIPFRSVTLSSGDTGIVASKTIDLEGWFPVQNAYRELASCSNVLDYQARRGNIKYVENDEKKLVHTLNNTAIATQRMLACMVENFQQKDGSIKIPKVLHKYAGFKIIKAKQ
ncbi:serine--tRNA ligase [Candidatus Woesearchaeota archaeon]|nr:serine--tRNA ligase [Candidatus Woesearchaeota archaeon]